MRADEYCLKFFVWCFGLLCGKLHLRCDEWVREHAVRHIRKVYRQELAEQRRYTVNATLLHAIWRNHRLLHLTADEIRVAAKVFEQEDYEIAFNLASRKALEEMSRVPMRKIEPMPTMILPRRTVSSRQIH